MKCEAKAKKKIPEINLVGRSIGPYREGEEIELRYWEIPILEDKGLIEPLEEISLVSLRKKLMSEQRSNQLEELPELFYKKVSNKIKKLKKEKKDDEAKEIKDILDSIIDSRVRKIFKLALTSSNSRNLLSSEKILIDRIKKSLSIWKDNLARSKNISKKEEIGAHEKQIRRSIQRIVRNPTNI